MRAKTLEELAAYHESIATAIRTTIRAMNGQATAIAHDTFPTKVARAIKLREAHGAFEGKAVHAVREKAATTHQPRRTRRTRRTSRKQAPGKRTSFGPRGTTAFAFATAAKSAARPLSGAELKDAVEALGGNRHSLGMAVRYGYVKKRRDGKFVYGKMPVVYGQPAKGAPPTNDNKNMIIADRVVDALKHAPAGLTVSEIINRLHATDWTTTSRNPRIMITVMLARFARDGVVRRISPGVYALPRADAAAPTAQSA